MLVREGSASRNLTTILRGVIEEGIDVSSLAFCTDDKHLADIRRDGTIRHCVQMAIELGMEPVRAIRLATINAARIYGLHRVGAVAPGWQADLVVLTTCKALRRRLFSIRAWMHSRPAKRLRLLRLTPACRAA